MQDKRVDAQGFIPASGLPERLGDIPPILLMCPKLKQATLHILVLRSEKE
jgi:hypothetical protein